MTWSTSETVASVRLPLNAVFFCLAEVVSHVICDVNAAVPYCMTGGGNSLGTRQYKQLLFQLQLMVLP